VLTKVAHLPLRSVRYLEAGKGRPVILVHAFPLSADQWLPQLFRVPAGIRYVAPDLRGFHGSGPAYEDLRLDGLTIDTYAADVLELMTHLEIPSATVVGLSMGGYVAFGMLRRAASRVSGLVLANTRAVADTDEGRAARDRTVELVRRNGPIGLGLEMLPTLLGETTRQRQPDLGDAVRRLIEANTPEAIVAALLAIRDRPDSTGLLASISCPVTVVAGDEDVLIPLDASRAMHAAIPGARLLVLPRTGHLSNLEEPAGFDAALESPG
jgi:pimeloyl-ACP methyl ester carboxylesterase